MPKNLHELGRAIAADPIAISQSGECAGGPAAPGRGCRPGTPPRRLRPNESADGEVLPPLTTDSVRWRKVIIGGTNRLTLRMMNDATRGFAADYKFKEKTIELTDNQDKAKSTFKFNRPDFEHLTVEGTFNGDTVAAKMRRVDETKMLLLSRGFHWISEVGMNR